MLSQISIKYKYIFKYLTPGICGGNFKNVISKCMLQIELMSVSFEVAFRWMPQNTFDDKLM